MNNPNDDEQDQRTNRKNTFSWSSTSSSCSTLLTNHEEDEEDHYPIHLYAYDMFLQEFLNSSNDKKQQKLSEFICRSASHGDVQALRHTLMNQTLRPFLNLDLADDENDGSTPLIYASCFGKLETVKFLLEVGAKVDVQDKIGWTALMWATTNGHSQIAQVLLKHSASFETKSKSGRTIYDLVDVENAKMVSTLTIQPSVLKEKRKSLCSIKTATVEYKQEEEKELEVCRASFRSVHKFVWDECLPDQMFVFAQEEVNHILNIAITELELPMKSKAEIYVPANIIFLSARFAHYFTSRELLHQLLSSTLERMNQVIKLNENNVHTIAFWISNVSQLLFYLKKDPGLVVATAEFQLEMSELISESYNFLVMDSEKRLGRIFEPAILEFEPLEVEAVEFADDWHRFFRRSRTSVSSPSAHRKSWIAQDHIRPILSPQSVTNLLSSILYVLHSYEVHPVIVIQAIAQLFHYLSCEIFNHILSNKRYLCRSKALQIRMNMTVLEEWVREYQLPNTLNAYFDPVIQLLQVLQCMSQLTDLMDFITTTKAFDLLNPIQLKRVVLDYRYEVSEAKLPEEIEKYTMQLAEDTFKSIQEEKKVSLSIDRNRPTSISSLGSLLHFSISQPKQQQQQQQRFSVSQEDDMAESNNRDSITEKRDSKYMLPFSLPTTTNYSGWRDKQPQISDNSTLSDTIYLQLKQKLLAEKNAKESNIVPSIPEDWLQRLDHHTK